MPEPTPDRELPQNRLPQHIGPFRVVRVLGEGGMGTVYLGERQELFSQRVAIKVLHPEISLVLGDALLKHEENILTSLDHPGIVRLLDRGDIASDDAGPGRGFIVMEYVDGLPLLEYSRLHALTEPQRLLLLVEMLQAVEYAHRHFVIHGDLKPGNILVTSDGKPKLLDFGVAALMRQAGSSRTASTPGFASPEQLAGARMTPASDIYSMGRMAQVLLADAPPNADRSAVLDKAMRSDPDQRYSSARQFGDDLQAVLDHRPVSACKASRGYLLRKWVRRNRLAAATAAVVLVALCGSVVGVAIQTARAEQQRSLAQSRLHDLARLTGTLQGELYDSLVPLKQAEPARAALIRSVTGSLDKLAAEDAGDSTLTLEVARQYQRLSSLPAADGASDRSKAMALLRGIAPGDANHAAATALMAQLQAR